MESETTVEKVMSLSDLEPVEGTGVDLEQYDKKEVKIEKASIIEVPSSFSETDKQWVLKVESEVVETLGEGEEVIEFRASELFNLIQDKEGKLIGYPENEKSNLQKFMKDLKVTKPEEIIGNMASIKSYEKKDRTYLKFRY